MSPFFVNHVKTSVLREETGLRNRSLEVSVFWLFTVTVFCSTEYDEEQLQLPQLLPNFGQAKFIICGLISLKQGHVLYYFGSYKKSQTVLGIKQVLRASMIYFITFSCILQQWPSGKLLKRSCAQLVQVFLGSTFLEFQFKHHPFF